MAEATTAGAHGAAAGPRAATAVVGFDGSELARAAMQVAMRRVGPAGRVLAVHAIRAAVEFVDAPFEVEMRDEERKRAERLLAELDGEQVATQVTEGPPAMVLVEAAHDHGAREIVVGSRGLGRFRAAFGSVSHNLIAVSDVPVVVVPAAAPGPLTDAPVAVVGYDGSEHAQRAVAYARRRLGDGGRLIAVFAYVAPPEWEGTAYHERSLELHRKHGRELLDRLAAESGEPAETVLVEGPPAEALVSVAHDNNAEEIVVGSRGFGPVRALLGSTSHALLHATDRPVVIVPDPARDERGGG
jgi:nucleotide-binding universal stress UspA family protein